jgi:hypothetical protein
MAPDVESICVLWHTDDYGTRRYTVYGGQQDGQTVLLGAFDQGPFDTSLEVAQWVWRLLAKQLPPSRC